MNFDLTSDQKMLVDTAASFAKKSSPVTRLRKLRDSEIGYEPKVWRQMGELGWLGVMFPEEVGGFGGTFVDVALVLEQFGKTLVPEPYIPAVILGGISVLHAGSSEQHKRWLPPLVDGQLTLALAYSERDSRFDSSRVTTTAKKDGSGYTIDGEKVWVLAGHAAEQLVVSARTSGNVDEASGVSLFVVDKGTKGVTIRPVKTMDGHRAAFVRFEGVSVGADAMLGGEGEGAATLEYVLDVAAAAACAEGLGVAAATLAMTLDYLKTREQFGVKIGTFQALQHRAVDMFVQVELCRSLSIEANIRVDGCQQRAGSSSPENDVLRKAAVSAAKVQLSRGGRFVTQQGIQLHGGIGCTDEHDVGLYFKRMQVLATMFGDEEYHVRRFASLPSFDAA